MSTDNSRDKTLNSDWRDKFRTPLDVNNIHVLPSWVQEEGFHYKAVIYTYKHDPERVRKHLDRGWEFVIAKADDVDDRSAATKAEKSIRERPIECRFSSGHKGVWMRISKERMAENEVAKRKQDIEKMVSLGQISKTEHGWKIVGPEYKHDL